MLVRGDAGPAIDKPTIRNESIFNELQLEFNRNPPKLIGITVIHEIVFDLLTLAGKPRR
jgi:hypothetical protein